MEPICNKGVGAICAGVSTVTEACGEPGVRRINLRISVRIEQKFNNMKTSFLFVAIISSIMLMSCQTDSEKADKLRIENKFDEAAELYQKAADEGDAYAKWRLSNAYSNGDGVDWNEAKALELLRQAAQEGCEEAKCTLAFAYMFDLYGIGKDIEKGKAMLDDLVKTTNNSFVLCRYAELLFHEGTPYEQNKEKAWRILERVDDKDNPFYCELMAEIYLIGTDKIDIDVEKAITFLEKAFDNGRRLAANRLVWIYGNGYDKIKKDKAKCIEWLNHGIDSNVPDCMVDMAMICLSKDSIYQDYRNPHKGVELLKKASLRGNGNAYYNLGNLYYAGEDLPKDDSKAFANWEKSSNLKNPDGASNLAYAYLEGVGCEKDVEKGIDIYKQAVDYGSGFSANKLFYCYWTGQWGVQKDKNLAKKYLLKAAELGDPWGCYNLGRQYFMGNDLVNKDLSQAFVYIKKAADMGLVDACNFLAYLYENGIGVDKDPQKAKEYKDKTIANSEKKEQ